jgi:hypothetical protein
MPPKFKNCNHKTKKEKLMVVSDCTSGWSKEPQWENDHGSFLQYFLLVLSNVKNLQKLCQKYTLITWPIVKQFPSRFWGVIGQISSVAKSNWSHVVTFWFWFLFNFNHLKFSPQIPLQQSVVFM